MRPALMEIVGLAVRTEVYTTECVRLARYVCKAALLLSELELEMHAERSLAEDPQWLSVLEGCVGPLTRSAELIQLCCTAPGGAIWPLEDAVGFQSAAAELREALARFGPLAGSLPADLAADVSHVAAQMQGLQFTETELEETCLAELQREQHVVGHGPLNGRPAPGVRQAEEAARTASSRSSEAGGAPNVPKAVKVAPLPNAPRNAPRKPLPDDPFGMSPRQLRASTMDELEKINTGEPCAEVTPIA